MFPSKYRLLLILLLAFSSANAKAQDQAAQRPPENYSARVMNVLGTELSTPRDFHVKISTYTSPEELQALEQILRDKDGQTNLQEKLRTHPEMGRFQVGTDIAYVIKVIKEEPSKQGRHIFLVANRFDIRPRAIELKDPRDYPFIVINLDLDDKGAGNGTFTLAAKLHVDKKRGLEVEDFLVQPAVINAVQRETP